MDCNFFVWEKDNEVCRLKGGNPKATPKDGIISGPRAGCVGPRVGEFIHPTYGPNNDGRSITINFSNINFLS